MPPNSEVKVGPTLKVGPSALQTGPTFEKASVATAQMRTPARAARDANRRAHNQGR